MKKILLIEDVADTVALVEKILTARGYDFVHAPDAETGLQLALQHLPDLILLDLGLPDYDGQTLAGWIRDEDVLHSIPLIAFTAWPEETAIQMVNSYGFTGYISKPIVSVNVFSERVASFSKMKSSVAVEIKLIPASHFTIDDLTGIYNQTRVDYMVPMPMNAARLKEYISVYDVDIEHSLVAMQGDDLRGVAMLGVRNGRAWITRLGVIPNTRRSGVGKALTLGLMKQAAQLNIQFDMLEVIKNNVPAHTLFLKLGFYEVGELLVLRRSPTPPPEPVVADAQRLDRAESLILVGRDRGTQPWTNQSESLSNAQEVSGLYLTLADGSRGWLVYQRQKFTLTRFIYKTEAGDPVKLAYAFLSHLHHQYPRLDTQLENIQVNDPHLPAFYKMGYVKSFRRIEMWWGTPPANLLPR